MTETPDWAPEPPTDEGYEEEGALVDFRNQGEPEPEWQPTESDDDVIAGREESYDRMIENKIQALDDQEIRDQNRRMDAEAGLSEEESAAMDGPAQIDHRSAQERFDPDPAPPVKDNPEAYPERQSQAAHMAELKTIIDGAESAVDEAQSERLDDLAFEHEFDGDGEEFKEAITSHIEVQEAEYGQANPSYMSDIANAKQTYISARAGQLQADGVPPETAHHLAAVEVRTHAWNEAIRAGTQGTNFAVVLHRQAKQLMNGVNQGRRSASEAGNANSYPSWYPK